MNEVTKNIVFWMIMLAICATILGNTEIEGGREISPENIIFTPKMDDYTWIIDMRENATHKPQRTPLFSSVESAGEKGSSFYIPVLSSTRKSLRLDSRIDGGAIGRIIGEEEATEKGILFYNFCHQTIEIILERSYLGTDRKIHTFHINKYQLAIYDFDRDLMYEGIDTTSFKKDEYVTKHNLQNYVIIQQLDEAIKEGKCVYVRNAVKHYRKY